MTDISDDMVRRMVDLVRGLASRVSNDDGDSGSFNAWNLISDCREARAIVAELPKPISIDLLEARRLAADDAEENDEYTAFVNDGAGGLTRLYGASLARAIRDGRGDDTVAVRGRLAAIKRGRELATGKEGC